MERDFYLIGADEFDASTGSLRRDGTIVPLGSRASRILKALAQAGGHPVSKDDLLSAAWPGMIMEESNLSVQIAALRKVLGHVPGGGERIVTVARIGYRLEGVYAERFATPRMRKPSLLVIPFVNIGGNPEEAYFAAGIGEELKAALSLFRSFVVVGGSASSPEADIRAMARDAGIHYLLGGSVRRSGSRLRISAELVDSTTLARLWTRMFDGGSEDVFEFQDRIVAGVATIIEPRIQAAEINRSRRERPGSSAVHDLFLRALAKISSEIETENAEAYALLVRALAAEPDSALLLSHAAWALEHRHAMGWKPIGPDDVLTCVEMARRALALAEGDTLVMAHCGMALLQVAKAYDWAVEVLDAAVSANPNNVLVLVRAGVASLHCGSLNDALARFETANLLSPGDLGSHFALSGIAHVHMARGDYAAALDWANRARVRNQHFDPILWILIAANANLGRLDEARRFLAELLSRAPGVTVGSIARGQPARDPQRMAALLEGLRLAGLPA